MTAQCSAAPWAQGPPTSYPYSPLADMSGLRSKMAPGSQFLHMTICGSAASTIDPFESPRIRGGPVIFRSRTRSRRHPA